MSETGDQGEVLTLLPEDEDRLLEKAVLVPDRVVEVLFPEKAEGVAVRLARPGLEADVLVVVLSDLLESLGEAASPVLGDDEAHASEAPGRVVGRRLVPSIRLYHLDASVSLGSLGEVVDGEKRGYSSIDGTGKDGACSRGGARKVSSSAL